MKSVWLSTLCLVLLITTWCIYDQYSDRCIHGFTGKVENEIMPAIQLDQWDAATWAIDELLEDWHGYKKVSSFFYDRSLLNETDYLIAKSRYYIRANDVSNSTGELACLIEHLTFLRVNERFHIENVL